MARRDAAPSLRPDRDVVVTCTLNWLFPTRSARWIGPISSNLLGTRYRHFQEATAGEWRQAERAARQDVLDHDRQYVEQLSQIVAIADALEIADGVVLWPRLTALAKAGTVTVTLK
jgi:hypothetical protein